MRSRHLNEKGVSHLLFLLLLVVAGAIIVVGLRVAGSQTGGTGKAAAPAAAVKVPAKIASQADVQKAAAALSATNINSGVDPTVLNSDLNSLL